MTEISAVLWQALPILLLILLGMLIRKTNMVPKETIAGLKKIVVNVALPATLFLAFSSMRFRAQYILIAGFMFILCTVMLILGIGVKRLLAPDNHFYPALFAGFEAGMMGYALFSSFYGAENTYQFAVIDIGQVIFVFFVLTGFLERQRGERASTEKLLANFFRSPVILSILIGILVGGTGLWIRIAAYPATEAITDTLQLLRGLSQPMICIIIGYELRIQFRKLFRPLCTVLLRMAILLFLAFLVSTFLLTGLLQMGQEFTAAVYCMFLLPPPFVIPIYMNKGESEDGEFILSTISMHIVLSLVAFLVLALCKF